MKTRRIFKKTLANELCEIGHKIIRVERNKFNSDYMVYVFESTFQLSEDLFKLTNR